MIVFFFHVQITTGAYNITTVNDFSNLGRIFVDFIKFYGLQFDSTKCVIFVPSPNHEQPDQESLNFIVRIHINLILFYE